LLKKQLIISLALLTMVGGSYLAMITSCANQGIGPSGGLKDSIPPQVVSCKPAPNQTEFIGNEIEIAFNEYISTDNLSEQLTISPPLDKKPAIRTKGKSVIVKIDDDLIPDRTYCLDFGNGIKDFNEGNKLENLRLVFSTGKQLDTLRISGFIYDAWAMTPVPNVLATLYPMDNDSLFHHSHPDFIARTDEKGYFLFDNLPAGEYKLFGLKDDDKNLYFSSGNELIAFNDSMIRPSALFIQKIDTIISGNDTTIHLGHTEFLPKNSNLLLFTDEQYSQFMVSFKRETNDRCLFIFNESVNDSLKINLIGNDLKSNWSEMEFSKRRDSISFWITDSIIYKKDTLFFKVDYPFTDSTKQTIIKTDTLKMVYLPSLPPSKQQKVKPKPTENYFRFSNNLSSSNFDLNAKAIIEAPSPVETPADGLFKLEEIINDSTLNPIDYKLIALKGTKRKFQLDFTLKDNTKYKLSLDTAVINTISGIPNFGFSTKFSTQKKDYYGAVILSIAGIERKGIIQVVKNDKQESLIRELYYSPEMKSITIDYLKPEKYLLKFIDDFNGNGKWDTGNLLERRKPEPVYYFEKELTVKSNWETKETWKITPGTLLPKPVIKEPSEKKKPGQQQ
jgi:hypothetical protein